MESTALNTAISFIVQLWVNNKPIDNFKFPDGRVISLKNNAVGSKKLAIIIKRPSLTNHYSPTSIGSLKNTLNNTRYNLWNFKDVKLKKSKLTPLYKLCINVI